MTELFGFVLLSARGVLPIRNISGLHQTPLRKVCTSATLIRIAS